MGKAKTPSLSDLLRAPSGGRAQKDVDAAATPGTPGKRAKTEAATAKLSERLSTCRSSCTPRALPAVIDGWCSSCRAWTPRARTGPSARVVGTVNPAGVQITSFKKPTRAELRHDFLWRINRAVPTPGHLGIFNRSQYEDVLVVRVHELVPKTEWSTRYKRINDWERQLVDDGVHLVKVFLHISKEEQKARLLARLDDPDKHWKFNPGDVDERRLWDDYTRAYADAIAKCSTEYAPWYVVPADRKWYRDFAVTSLLVEALTAMAPQYPPAAYDVDEQRARVLAT